MGSGADFFNKLGKKNGDQLNVCIVGKIISYNSAANTADVEPLLNSLDGIIPVLTDVPVMFFNSGGITIKCVPKINDRVLVMFADYDSDNIVIDGVTIDSNTDRTHALEDAFAIPFNFNPINNSFGFSNRLEIKHESGSRLSFKNNGDVEIVSTNDIKFTTSRGTASANARLFD